MSGGYIDYDMKTNGEEYILKILSGINKVIFDIGGNHGEWTEYAYKYNPNSKIHVFEIVPYTADICERTINNIKGSNGDNIKLNKFGLSDKESEIDVKYYPNGDGCSSIYDYPHSGENKIVNCKVSTGDIYVNKNDVNSINFMKMDTEGHEYKILLGFENMLKRGKIDVIQFEYGKVNIINHHLLYDYYNLLTKCGYVIGKLQSNGVLFKNYSFDDEDFRGPNYIAVLKNKSKLIEMLSIGYSNVIPMYIINLKRRPDRKLNIIKQLSNIYSTSSFDHIHIVQAVDGKEISDELDKKYFSNISNLVCTPGIKGCSLSHLFLWEQLINDNVSNAVILEDDAIFDKNFKVSIEKIKSIKSDFDVLILGCHYFGNRKYEVIKTDGFTVEVKQLGYSTVGYYTTLNGLIKLRNNFKCDVPLDIYFQNAHETGIIKFKVLKDLIVSQADFKDSDTEK